MTTLKEFSALLDAATGPSRELDSVIACFAHPTPIACRPAKDAGYYISPSSWVGNMPTGKGSRSRAQDYTASMDAAMALVERMLPGWAFNVCFRDDGDTTGDDAGWSVEFRRPYEWLPFSTAPTAPLAILKALVAALIAQETTDE